MKKSLKKILAHRKTYYSQNGEDGVLEYLLSKLPERDKWCVEFGAWDGKYLSNTYHFLSNSGYAGVLIEGDTPKAELLKANMKEFNTICINKYIDMNGANSLDNILSQTPIPNEFDLLSIDVDGNDYHIWQSLETYHPKIVIIEINVLDKPDIERINTPNSPFVMGVSGTSIKSMTELASLKGYRLVANVSCNAIYVKEKYYDLFHDSFMSPSTVFLYEGHDVKDLTLKELRNLSWRRLLKGMLRAGGFQAFRKAN